jgi:hypothetical protein
MLEIHSTLTSFSITLGGLPIYTNSDKEVAEEIQKGSDYNDITYDHRGITRFTKLPESILIKFEDGKTKGQAFIVHRPGTKVNPSFVDSLGL